MASNSLVSIITPSYNCGRFIADTIRSVQAQTYTEWEMIIVDDNSTDDTERIVNEFVASDGRIRYYRNENNAGAALSRNWALREAKGRWIAFLDSDDLWLPEKLERQIAFMQEKGYDFTYHEYDEIDEESEALGVHVGGKSVVRKWEMYSCCWPGCLTVMYDSTKIGLVQIADIKKNNDTAMWLKVSQKATCHLLPESLALYRRRKNSITPVGTWGKVKAHYPLFHIAEGMNPVHAWGWTFANVLGNAYKKIFYVKKI